MYTYNRPCYLCHLLVAMVMRFKLTTQIFKLPEDGAYLCKNYFNCFRNLKIKTKKQYWLFIVHLKCFLEYKMKILCLALK